MNSAGWVVDENEEDMKNARLAKTDRHHAFCKKEWFEMYKSRPYSGNQDIDQDEALAEEDYSQWNNLPDLLLEQIFAYLSIKERYYASCVCSNWNRIFYLPYVWREFVLEDQTLTRSKFNYYLGWQYVLDHLRTSLCLQTIGRNIKRLIIRPMFNFSNLYEFMNILSWYIEKQITRNNEVIGVGNNIYHLKFTFPCDMNEEEDEDRVRLFGTGGKLLEGLKRLMSNLTKLQSLELVDLMLEPSEAQFLLDEVCQTCCLSLRKLSLVNTTKTPYQILHVGVFLNLFELHISPQNLGNDLVELLGFTNLKHLHIVQNKYTTDGGFIKPVSPSSWKKVRLQNQCLSVHLQLEGKEKSVKSMVWQEGAPVRTILYDSPYIGISADTLITTIDLFGQDLRTYGHLNVPKFQTDKSFSDRNDENLVLLIRSCKYLTTLVITEKISTSTVLLLAYTGRNLKWLHIRENAVLDKCDWPRSLEWTDEFYSWLKTNSKLHELVEKEVSQILGYRWAFLSDDEFSRLEVNLHDF
ncbi:uncharacterized protein [Euwallacea similis]|uniref:uncharacterized protein isoform X1 n=1 Tax=Euwallacea similis TaxID=1736056 RepID=UPI00344FD73D